AITLRDEQLFQFGFVMEEEGIHLGSMLGGGGFLNLTGPNSRGLRAYATLAPRQRAALQQGEAVDSGDMPPQAQKWLEAALALGQRSATVDPAPARRGL